jgi:AraC-like DNA-binding protein
MRVSLFEPSKHLAPWVSALRVVETAEDALRVLVPDGDVTLGIRYSGSATMLEDGEHRSVPGASFAPLRTTARHMFTRAGGGVVLAAFRPGGAARFFAHPLHEVFGETLELDLFLRRSEIERAQARIGEAKSHAARVQVMEEILSERLRPEEPDLVVSAAVRAIRERNGCIRISELCAALDIRIDPLEKRFRSVVGASPKQLASILRVKQAFDSYRPGINLARLSVDSGFSDQSHFIREFRRVFGDSPQRFFRTNAHC